MNFSLQLHKGEILGVGGLSHCGMHELGRALFGEEKILNGSVIHVTSRDQITSAISALQHQIGYVSKNRDVEAFVLTASIKDNIIAVDRKTKQRTVKPSGYWLGSVARTNRLRL